ncbi:hypothetical protein [Sulfurimonas sp. HSL-1716]|uniref:hypothetical protein n=1 Tax=Hydrocurvibacter sulfurireducens TaxID=3131937 RepID=UPI0031F82EE2
MVEVKSKQTLKDAILSGEDEIKVDNPELEKWIILIHGIKQVTWSVAICLVAAGIYSLLATPATGGSTTPVSAIAAGGVSVLIGMPAAIAMISLGVVMGGIVGLKAIRNNYRIMSKTPGALILKRKHSAG